MRRKVLTIFGTRPEATKMAPVVQALRRRPEWFDVRVAVTGQHREQLDQVLAHFGIVPDHDLDIMQPRQTLSYIVTAALVGLEEVIRGERPDMVLVHGDTHTTLAGTLAAYYNQVPVGHVEAGLRTYNKYSPFPEEMNRRLTDAVADLLFAPTPANRENLLREGIDPSRIFVTGQTGVDATLITYREDYRFHEPRLREVDFGRWRVVAVTAHRRENWGEPMRQMFTAMRELVETHPDVLLVYPVHLGPAVREVAFPILSGHPRILLLDPIDYPDMINLLARSYLVLSDSGGLQEETPVFGRPLVLMRDTTERPEAVAAGTVVLAGTSREAVYAHAHRLLSDAEAYAAMARARNPFGDGRASERIAGILAHHFGLAPALPSEFAP
ncbi:non-hydrolyzing UDP-N-acetylglucosamine 2-epimerase [Caldinitratiruptor microaerophilus]|uniref:UDP-N-acetylglucosamine 2-epimerase (non-hydrolyzing) n=1 Tax=Caldinitratiruptor microaerophilus TaxID=671077 RepID=A0AA35CM76_9FIRM|nr:UDP-N-acetylglucosamine 2-epimerase (non-hydrolyzing) [Caldinitratiruptor microaerophilus]BDG61772.1 UDP-N-acetyl glucosamine 2-epimerase [Caldinitratiruptor microaerophilus]